ncbi:MAG: S-methyl-5-thioribose-1-phosphate isomerase [Deferribacteres bacterium]|nr:S-methyl-5-thioribose-1-phosphate isomerase [candidate division KSB1 bacterium]MCB9502855.1 S-methyl-5-thioribose-1-phosphate isomerase [Deferribacteres bacterium]
MPVTTISWSDEKIRIIDQTQLPLNLVYFDIADVPTLCEAIVKLRVRGAPAIGIAAAFGVYLGIKETPEYLEKEKLFTVINTVVLTLKKTRPTAVNLAWALDQMLETAQNNSDKSPLEIKSALLVKALQMYEDDREINRRLAEHGASLIPQNAQIITHCNTGALATVDYGTALGSIFLAHSKGKKVHVWVDETRPLLQGARLNMWELQNEGVDCTLICDNTAAFVMQRNKIDLCIVGADRIAANGDTANKIGTFSLAVIAKYHNVPFYIAAPMSSFDQSLASGAEIPIEERSGDEVVQGFGQRIAPENSHVYSPAFDVTPNELITAIITDKGIIKPPFNQNILFAFSRI